MNPWIDAIDKLRFRGYSFTLDQGKLKYAYRGKGNPSNDEITSFLTIQKAHKADILKDLYFLIEQTIQAINEHWEPGTLGRLSPEAWERVKAIEREINRSVFSQDTDGLRKSLEAYKKLFLGVVLGEGQGNLFDQRR